MLRECRLVCQLTDLLHLCSSALSIVGSVNDTSEVNDEYDNMGDSIAGF